jgi:hypothetical protein
MSQPTSISFRALCAELADRLDDALTYTVQSDTERSMRQLIARTRAALAQPEPEGPGPVDYRRWHEAHSEDCSTWSEEPTAPLTLRTTVEALAWANYCLARFGRPAIKPAPVAERFEFSVFNSEYEEQAGGAAPTYAQALSEGQHYLSEYSQDGPHSLEIRRVEVLPHYALPVPTSEEAP